jgi:hypothetical protein
VLPLRVFSYRKPCNDLRISPLCLCGIEYFWDHVMWSNSIVLATRDISEFWQLTPPNKSKITLVHIQYCWMVTVFLFLEDCLLVWIIRNKVMHQQDWISSKQGLYLLCPYFIPADHARTHRFLVSLLAWLELLLQFMQELKGLIWSYIISEFDGDRRACFLWCQRCPFSSSFLLFWEPNKDVIGGKTASSKILNSKKPMLIDEENRH